jgi:CHASE2 domain-containing sensor protein
MKITKLGWLKQLGGGSSSLLFGGAGMTLMVCLARMIGILEGIELQTLDFLLKWRSLQPVDERITILEFTDADIQALGTYPVPDSVIHKLLEDLQVYQPRVIGLDIFRDIPVPDPTEEDLEAAQEANQDLLLLLQDSANIVSIERIFPPSVQAPPGVPPENVGFADALLDRDGFVRRSLLGSLSPRDQQYRLSLTIQLASKYLAVEGFELDNGIHDPNAMRFGHKELFRVKSNSGGYINQDTANNPVVLINFRNNPEPFNQLTWSEFIAGDFSEDWLRDRLILISMNASSTKDYVNSAAIPSSNPGLVPGVKLQAHAVSQIISAVLDDRPILKTWNAQWEYLSIVVAGVFGILFVHVRRSAIITALLFIILISSPFFMGYLLVFLGIWMPVFPVWAALSLSGSSAVIYRVYRHEQVREIQLRERQRIIRQSYNMIHNRPLQTLKVLMRKATSEQKELSPQDFHGDLKNLDGELRDIYEFMEKESFVLEANVYLRQGKTADLDLPLHEVLHQIYRDKLNESAHFFDTIKIKIVDFCFVPSERLSLEEKENIIRFLEEALCNVEQHAKGVTRLTVACKQIGDQVVVQVVDNGERSYRGMSTNGALNGRGTRQANELALQLGGEFIRKPHPAKGTICELSWPIFSPSIWKLGLRWLQISASRLFQRRQ